MYCFALTMFNLGNGTWNLSLIFHDIIMDDASFGIVLSELFTLYNHGLDSLPEQQVQFSDFSDWFFLDSDSRIESREGQVKFWTENLKDVQPVNLRFANASDTPLSDTTRVEATIDPTTLSNYCGIADESKTTPSVGFFAAFSVLLFRLSLQASFVMDTPVNQRLIPRLANVVGPITNMLPITTTIDGNQSFHDYLAGFKANFMTSLANTDMDYEDLHNQSANHPLHSLHGGYFTHVFAHDGLNLSIPELASHKDDTPMHLGDIRPLSKIKRPHELFLDVYSKSGRVILRFDNHLFSAETARKILDNYIAVVGTIALNPYVQID